MLTANFFSILELVLVGLSGPVIALVISHLASSQEASVVIDRIWNRFFDFTYMFWRDAYSAEGKRKYDLEHFGYPTKPDVEKPFFCANCGHQLEKIFDGVNVNDPFGNTLACPVCVPSAFNRSS